MKIGILECGHTIDAVAERHGGFPAMFKRLLEGNDFTFASYDVENMEFPNSVTDCDGWLLTGSKHGAYEDHAFIPPLENFIKEAFEANIPMVGICFGHQIIAQAMGGHVEKFENGWSLGLTEYEFEGLGAINLNAWHQDQVIARPETARRLATNDFCENAALIYGQHALTIQAHPEFHGEIIEQYVDIRRGTLDYPDDRMDIARTKVEQVDNNSQIARLVADFFITSRNPAHV